jgi:gliding motility-associated-like protein
MRISLLKPILTLLCVLFCALVFAQLRADFVAQPTTGCVPVLVRFTDRSTGNPTEWKWNLGNGTTSTQQNPTATYLNAGRYTIRLFVRNSQGADSLVKQDYIIINPPPLPAFAANQTSGCFPLRVQFTDQSAPQIGNIASWQWDFGDGNFSTQQNPVHTYTVQGNFSVSLKVVNTAGCEKVLTKQNFISLNNGVLASFTHTAPPTCTPPAAVQFTSTSFSTGTPTYSWDFGDGTSSPLQNPSHTYTGAGTFTVKLTVRNNTGCVDSVIKLNLINIGTVNASFTAPDTVCAKANFQITNTSTPATAASNWNFGDGTTSQLINPTKKYNSPGSYTITLNNDFGVCTGTTSKNIFVRTGPIANFSQSVPQTCVTPINVTFSNATSPAVSSYNWIFGDGSTSGAADPVHLYAQPNNYNVTLVATDGFGCRDTIKKIVNVLLSKPKIDSIGNLPQSGCLPYTFSPTPFVTSFLPIATYEWSFGDGGTATGSYPTHVYTTQGIYTIKLKVTTSAGCVDSLTVPFAVSVGFKPQASFYAAPLLTCAQDSVVFFNTSTSNLGNQLNYLWLFGDGGASTLDTPKHQYSDTGYFDVTLIAFNYGCADTIRLPRYVRILGPVANFVDTFNCGNPQTRFFLDRSIGALRYRWSFGDGATDTVANPVHTYAALGIYEVKLWVTNDTCSFEKKKKINIFKLAPNFSVAAPFVCRNDSVRFTAFNVDTNLVVSYKWYFGDGTFTETITPKVSHTYYAPANYTVSLVTTDINGCRDSIAKPAFVKIYGPTASFSPTGGCWQKNILFTSTSTSDSNSAIVQWNWNFGDGSTVQSNVPTINHAYQDSGFFSVLLTVTDANGCKDAIFKPDSVLITNPKARFTSSDTLICAASPVQFNNLSFGNNISFKWLFGDGDSSTASNPIHNFVNEGNYAVQLILMDVNGCKDTARSLQPIVIANAKAAFAMSDSFSTCPPLIVNFTNNSINADSIIWNFDDGSFSNLRNPQHFYSFGGTFNVKLKIFGNGGCTDTASKNILIKGPSGTFSYGPLEQCKPGVVNFTSTVRNTSTYIWDFNNGQTITTPDSAQSYAYREFGYFVPKLILQDAAGCTVPIQGMDTIKIFGVKSIIRASSTVLCDSGFVNFNSDSTFSNDTIVNAVWNFGDGSTSVASNPSHTYTTPGTYNVSFITTTQRGCIDTARSNLPIKIVASPIPQIQSDSTGCVPASVTFVGSLATPDTSAIAWQWNFGNGQTSNLQNPIAQTYSNAGPYIVSLTTTNSSGCTKVANRLLNIYALPIVDAGPDMQICKGQTVNLNATGALTYIWSSNNSVLSCTNCVLPISTPTSSSKYYVQGTDIHGCINRDSLNVDVQQPQRIVPSLGDTICVGQKFRLSAGGTDLYNWEPATDLSNPTSASTLASPQQTTTYKVIGRDSRNCFRDSAFITVIVYPYPVINVLPDSAVTISNGGAGVQLSSTLSSDVVAYAWTPPAYITCVACPNPVVRPLQTTTYTLKAKNIAGCTAVDAVTINVICNDNNIFIPNTFSPNSDGVNDQFYTRGKGLFTIKTMRVFNRWGELMMERKECQPNDPSCGWDGTYKGAKASSDVYVYVIEVLCENANLMQMKGNVTLIR